MAVGFSNTRGAVSIRRRATVSTPRTHTSVASASMRAPQGVPARPAAHVQQGKFYGAPEFGAAPRSSTAQGVHNVTKDAHATLSSQTLYPKPTTLAFKPSTGRVSYTAPFGSSPTDTHAGTQTGVTQLRPYGGPPPQPLQLGSYLMVGRATLKRQILAPPQPNLIPHAFRKLISRRG